MAQWQNVSALHHEAMSSIPCRTYTGHWSQNHCSFDPHPPTPTKWWYLCSQAGVCKNPIKNVRALQAGGEPHPVTQKFQVSSTTRTRMCIGHNLVTTKTVWPPEHHNSGHVPTQARKETGGKGGGSGAVTISSEESHLKSKNETPLSLILGGAGIVDNFLQRGLFLFAIGYKY